MVLSPGHISASCRSHYTMLYATFTEAKSVNASLMSSDPLTQFATVSLPVLRSLQSRWVSLASTRFMFAPLIFTELNLACSTLLTFSPLKQLKTKKKRLADSELGVNNSLLPSQKKSLITFCLLILWRWSLGVTAGIWIFFWAQCAKAANVINFSVSNMKFTVFWSF